MNTNTLDAVAIVLIIFGTSFSFFQSFSKSEQMGSIAPVLGSLMAAILNAYIVWRLWP